MCSPFRRRLPEVEEAGSSSSSSSKTRQGIRQNLTKFAYANTSYGPVLQELELPLATGGTVKWQAFHPMALLWLLCSTSTAFADIVENKLASCSSSPSRPLHIIFYVDEASPGNLLKIDNSRKCQAFYFSIGEFGHDLLCHEHVWLLAGVIRSNLARQIDGGLACVWKHMLHLFFGREHNFATSGAVLPLNGDRSCVLFAKLGCVVADEPALKSLWCCKGSGGMKPCMLCKNVVLSRLDIAEHGDNYLIDLSCGNTGLFDEHDDTSIYEMVDTLADSHASMNRQEFHTLEKVFGMNYVPQSVLQDKTLRPHILPKSSTMYDWMHVFLVGGLANTEIFQWLQTLKSCRIGYKEIQGFMAPWHFPILQYTMCSIPKGKRPLMKHSKLVLQKY